MTLWKVRHRFPFMVLLCAACGPATTQPDAVPVAAPLASATAPSVIAPTTVAPPAPARTAAPVQRDPVAAEAAFVKGRKLFAEGDFAAACPAFAESHALDPAIGTLLNLAECENKLGDRDAAIRHFDEAAALAEHNGQADRAAFAKRRADALRGP